MPAENGPRSRDLIRIDFVLRGEGKKQGLILTDMIEDTCEKMRLPRCLAHGFEGNACHFEKTGEPARLGGNEAKGRHCHVQRPCLLLLRSEPATLRLLPACHLRATPSRDSCAARSGNSGMRCRSSMRTALGENEL